MYKNYYPVLLALLLCFTSCQSDTNTFGKELVSSAFRNVLVDTCTVTFTTVQIDSLDTSGKNLVVVGNYTHPLWGITTAGSYVAYTRPSYSTDIEQLVVFDSLMLNLTYNSHFRGDTTRWQKINIHRLTELISLNDNGYLYNTSTVAYDPELIGSYSFRPKPNSGQELEIRLSDALGKDLLARFHSRDERVSADRFPEYFKGINILPDTYANDALVSFQLADTMTSLTLHYHIKDELDNEQMLIFSPNTSTQFNQIVHNRAGTLLAPYPRYKNEIPSVELDNRFFLSGLTGWYTRVEFPYLNNLMQQGERIEIESALLRLYPERGTYSDFNPLPDSLYLYIADQNNVVTDAVKDYLGTEVQGATLVKEDAFGENIYYYFDITDFLNDELGAFGIYKHNLQLVFPSADYTSTLKNLTFGDQSSSTPIKLQVTYKIYDSY